MPPTDYCHSEDHRPPCLEKSSVVHRISILCNEFLRLRGKTDLGQLTREEFGSLTSVATSGLTSAWGMGIRIAPPLEKLTIRHRQWPDVTKYDDWEIDNVGFYTGDDLIAITLGSFRMKFERLKRQVTSAIESPVPGQPSELAAAGVWSVYSSSTKTRNCNFSKNHKYTCVVCHSPRWGMVNRSAESRGLPMNRTTAGMSVISSILKHYFHCHKEVPVSMLFNLLAKDFRDIKYMKVKLRSELPPRYRRPGVAREHARRSRRQHLARDIHRPLPHQELPAPPLRHRSRVRRRRCVVRLSRFLERGCQHRYGRRQVA